MLSQGIAWLLFLILHDVEGDFIYPNAQSTNDFFQGDTVIVAFRPYYVDFANSNLTLTCTGDTNSARKAIARLDMLKFFTNAIEIQPKRCSFL